MVKTLEVELSEAVGLIELEMYKEAWEALDRLRLKQRRSPPVILLRVWILMRLGRLIEAESLLHGLNPMQVLDKWSYHYISAVLKASTHDLEGAREHVSHAVQLNSGCQRLIERSAELKAIW